MKLKPAKHVHPVVVEAMLEAYWLLAGEPLANPPGTHVPVTAADEPVDCVPPKFTSPGIEQANAALRTVQTNCHAALK
jgi:hypothetical protein